MKNSLYFYKLSFKLSKHCLNAERSKNFCNEVSKRSVSASQISSQVGLRQHELCTATSLITATSVLTMPNLASILKTLTEDACRVRQGSQKRGFPINSGCCFFNWDSLDARLNSHYKAWSYKKRLEHTGSQFRKNLQIKDVC